MPSDTPADSAYVWAWLPGADAPVIAGRIDRDGSFHTFTYAASYLARPDALSLYLPELPLVDQVIDPLAGDIAGCLRDAAPDGWGQRVIENDHASNSDASYSLGILDFLLRASPDRVGCLGFSSSRDVTPTAEYVPATLADLMASADRVEAGEALDPEIDRALILNSSPGGAYPKAFLRDDSRSLIAKFSSRSDSRPVLKGEFVAMDLARQAGIEVAAVTFTGVLGRDVLLVERFDRPPSGGRRAFVSALTILGLDEIGARHATYWELADIIRARFTDPDATLRELFARITFNILVSNTDDHARNHGAFWDGRQLTLTPAYDICPQPRIGGEQQQAMAIGSDGYRLSQLAGCLERAGTYHLDQRDAREIVDHQVDVIHANWNDACDAAEMTDVERSQFWKREFLNPFVFEGY